MTDATSLTDNELKALAYFAVGVTSEGSIGGRDVSYRLSFAGSVAADGRMRPVANSGYSFGTLQIDLGQHPDVARDLADQYGRWASSQTDRGALAMGPGEEAALLQALKRTGREMRAEGAHDIDRAPLNRFFSSDTGRSFVHELDRQHAEAVTRTDAVTGNRDSALERLQRTPLYRDASEQDQASLGALFMKLENQSGRAYTPRLLTRIEDGSLASTTTVKSAIDALIPDSANGNPDYIQSGADNTLRGVRVFNALRTAAPDSPLREAWTSVIADPLMGPVVAHAGHDRDGRLGAQYDTVRSLFLTPEASLRMIDALDRGATLAQGDPALRQGRRAAGFYVSGQDFVHWNASGDGAAYVEGRWRGIDADQLQRIVHRDGTTELRITEDGRSETLLHVDLPTRTNDGRRADHRPELPNSDRPATREVHRTLLADDRRHPDYPAFERIHAWASGTGRWDEEQSRNIAAALYRAQVADPLVQRVDDVTSGRGQDGAENVAVFYAPYGAQSPVFHVRLDARTAAQEPAAQNLQQAELIAAQQRGALQEERSQVTELGVAI